MTATSSGTEVPRYPEHFSRGSWTWDWAHLSRKARISYLFSTSTGEVMPSLEQVMYVPWQTSGHDRAAPGTDGGR